MLNIYEMIIEEIFKSHYQKGLTDFEFEREEIEAVSKRLKINLPKNIGDLIYSFRYRNQLPEYIRKKASKGREWIIESSGRSKYRFSLVSINRIVPNPNLVTIKIPNATPELIVCYAKEDEQALLAKVRYNRLIDIFLGITTYSLQNHLRTTVKGIGQIEIDELYIGIDKSGNHFIIPVQAKGGKDQLSVIQTKQDIGFCLEKYGKLTYRPVSAQFMSNELIAMFELTLENEIVKVVSEKHYKLVPADQISDADLNEYKKHSTV